MNIASACHFIVKSFNTAYINIYFCSAEAMNNSDKIEEDSQGLWLLLLLLFCWLLWHSSWPQATLCLVTVVHFLSSLFCSEEITVGPFVFTWWLSVYCMCPCASLCVCVCVCREELKLHRNENNCFLDMSDGFPARVRDIRATVFHQSHVCYSISSVRLYIGIFDPITALCKNVSASSDALKTMLTYWWLAGMFIIANNY